MIYEKTGFKKLIALLELLGFEDNSLYNSASSAFIYSYTKNSRIYKFRCKVLDNELKFSITNTDLFITEKSIIVSEDSAIIFLKEYFKEEFRKIKINKLLLECQK